MNLKEKKFIKLAEIRANNAIKAMKLLGNLANKSNYTYNEFQVKKILNALSGEINNLKSSFQSKNKKKFKL